MPVNRAVSAATFKDAMAQVATPVSIVTTLDAAGRPHGVTVSTLTSVSLDPPLVMFCLGRTSRSHRALTTAPRVLIHVLRDDQAALAARFARTGTDRFTGLGIRWRGLPAIPHTVVRLACSQHKLVDGGDHTLILCQVEEAQTAAGHPLLYHARNYCAPTSLALLTAVMV